MKSTLRRLGPLALLLAALLARAFDSATRASEEHGTLNGLRVLDGAGGVHVLGSSPGSRGLCVVLLAIDCPIATESLPELGRLARLAASLRIEFFGLISDPFALSAEVQRLTDSTHPSFPLLVDANGVLARRLRPTTTPEAFLFDAAGELAYRGRIDDRGRRRIGLDGARRRDLQEALDALGNGRPVPVPRTGAIGCAFEGWPETEAQEPAQELTWTRHVAPILAANCRDCHRPGGSAPFALERFEDAARRSKMIARVALERTMPPWHAVAGFGDLRNARQLDEREIRVLEQWSLSGAPRGADADAVGLPRPRDEPAPTPPDLVLDVPAPLAIPADGPDLVRELELPAETNEPLRVRAVQLRFSEPRLVRSALLFSVGPASLGGTPSRRQISAWVSSTELDAPSEGAAWCLPTSSRLSLWLHLHPTGVASELRISLALWLASPDSDELLLAPIPTNDAQLTSDGHGWTLRAEHRLEQAARVVGLIPRMDPRGLQLKLVAHPPEGPAVPLLWIHRWDSFWPETYRLRSPLRLPGATILELEARFDDPGKRPGGLFRPPDPLPSAGVAGDLARCTLELVVPARPCSGEPERPPH